MKTQVFTPFAIPGVDDEAAEEPEDEVLPPPVIADLIPVVEDRRRLAPPPTAVVSAPATTPPTPDIAQFEAAEQIGLEGNGVEQAGYLHWPNHSRNGNSNGYWNGS